MEYAGNEYPSGRELEFILDTAYCFGDLVPLPTLPNITQTIDTDTRFVKYTAFLEVAVHFLRSFNEKPIMGVVPRLAYGFVANLMEFYINEGINAFCVDFEARNPTTFRQNLLPIFRTLARHDLVDDSFVYAHNVDAGRFIKARNVVNAKDILSFGFGFDAIGRRHKPLRMPRKEWQKLNTLPNKLRLFCKDDYGYYKILSTRGIRDMFPSDSCVPINMFTGGLEASVPTIRRYEKLFNAEQIGLEAFRLRHILRNYTPTEYLGSKRYVREQYVRMMKRFRDDIFKQKSLGNFHSLF